MRKLRAERLAEPEWPAKRGDPNVVPYALSYAVNRCGAKDKGEAQRAIAALVADGRIVLEYVLPRRGKRYGTRCYSLGGTA